MFEYPRETLIKLDNTRNREIFARVTVLDKYERPIESIEGKITGSGSVNVDGNSAVRRSISLSMVAQDVKIHNVYWGLTSRVKIEIGLRDMDAGNNSQIYWFKAGIYVLTEFRTQQSLNNLTISLSGKDKMCLLNGEVGGHFMADTDLGLIEEIDEEDNISRTALRVSTIIKEMLIGIGGELPQNIILNNIDKYGVEMLQYKGEDPLYVVFEVDKNIAVLYSIGLGELNEWFNHTISESEELEIRPLSEVSNNSFETLQIERENKIYAIYKVLQHQACGYRLTELTYPGGELIARVGETITSVLDKIKNQFGSFEYFYDLDGHFVFQTKQLYLNNSYNARTDYTLTDTESYIENSFDFSKYSYYFNSNNLVTALNNTPQLGSIKNDFAIWGENANGLAIHLRYAIDKKPTEYCSLIDGKNYTVGEIKESAVRQYNQTITEKRNLIEEKNQVINDANDEKAKLERQRERGDISEQEYQTKVEEQNNIIQAAESAIETAEAAIETAKAQKAEKYVNCCDWRELIYRMALDWFKYYHHGGVTDDSTEESEITPDNFVQKLQEANKDNALGEQLRLFGKTGYEQYYTDLQGFWRYLYNPYDNDENHDPVTGYNLLIDEDPASLLFYFDFLDADGSEVGSYSVYNVGDRTKTQNNNAIKVIKYEEVPNILFYFTDSDIDPEEEEARVVAEGYYNIFYSTEDEGFFDIAARGKSCYVELDDLLYNCTYVNQSVSLTTLPIYYLEPNVLIYIRDEINDINGEFAINRMTIPLTYNGTMSITANKVPQRLY